MVNPFLQDQVLQIIAFQAVILLVLLSNIFLLRRARKHAPPLLFPKVSVLVPARNEEKNIRRCIQSLLAQDYPAFEVFVLDDQSSDSTLAILEQMARTQPRLKVLVGSSPPAGRLGKNWACVQLAQEAQGDLLFFTDADTFHQPQTLRASVTALIGEQADMLTGFPHQELGTWGERLLVPFFSWAFLCFTPLWLAYRLRFPALSNAVGQMILFRRDAYQAIGGHERVVSVIVDDLMLARRIKGAGLRWRVMRLADLITCRMYRSSRETYDGFVKNFFAAFDFHLLTYLFVFMWLGVMFWKPLILLALAVIEQAPQTQIIEPGICIGISLLLWLIPYWEMGIPLGLGLLYPVTILAAEGVAFQSLRLSLTGRLRWKDRTLDRPNWKWL